MADSHELQQGAASTVGLLDLGSGPLSAIFKHLDAATILRAAQACRALHHAAQDDSVWQVKAQERYPADTVRLDHYASHQELVRDDNVEQAALFLPLGEGRSCVYKFAETTAYYECLVLGLEWDRAAHTFRLYFEARGEHDLRSPGESSVGFLVHRPPPPDRRTLERRLRQLQERRRELQRSLADAISADAHSAIVAAEHELARNATQHQATELELGRRLELRFADLLTVVRPTCQRLLVDVPGHKLGILEFDSLNKIDQLLGELPDSYASKQEAVRLGMSLCFCYANPIPVMPHGAVVDYEPCILATVLPGASLLDAFRQQGRYCVPGRLLQELEGEDAEARRARWAHLPEGVKRRGSGWLV